MIWLVPNNLFWLVSVNHFWLVNGLGPVRSDSGVFVCDRFFAFGNSRLFPERGSLMSDSEMNGARFDMANKDVILSFELRLFWSSLLHCIDKYLWHQRLHSWNAVFAVPWSSCVIGLKWRHQSGVGADSMLTLSLILMTYTEIREHWLTWPVVPSVVPQLSLSTMLRNDEIAQSVYRNLVPKDRKTPAFYFLPKIHKQNITGRPIISGNNSPTEKISAFVDEHIKQFVPHIKSYVRDTPDFIKKIENFKLNGDYFLVTMDVTSLYTNIPNHEGLVAVTQTLIRENAQFRANNRSLITLLQHVLHMNNFRFNGENYLQIGGTAMGTRVAPSYANLFMARLEEKLIANCEYTLPLYLRYIDDIFLIFPYSEQDLTKFMTYMNNAHPTIKFTEEHSRSEIVFLDTVVKRLNENLYTDLYTKPTDTHSYLHFTSSHPKHTRHNGPYGQFLRLRRNCHFDDDFNRHADAMTQHYLKRGYPQDLITQSRHRAFAVLHHDLIHKSVTKRATNNRLPIVLTYNLTNPDIIGLVTKFWPILQTSVKGAILFKDPPVRAFRRSPNLRDHLVKAALKSNTPKTTPYPQQFCKKQDCQTCKSIKRRDKLPQNNREYKLAKDVNCLTNNVVYLLECTRCKKQYVGETKRNFLTRFKEHLADIRHNRDTPVAKHFNLNSHKTAATPAQPIPTILSRIAGHPDRTTDVRKNKEKMWIHTLRSTAPHGINVRE